MTVDSRALVVLTSARSGSSVATRALQALGVDLGDRLRPGARKNPKGFYEDIDILKLSRRLRDRVVQRRRLALVPPERWQDADVRALEDQAVALLARRFGANPLWGFKTGRTLRFLPFWDNVFGRLDMRVSYLVALRNPLSAATSRSRARGMKMLDHDAGTWVNLAQWLVETVPHFDRLQGRHFAVTEFDLLSAQPRQELERIGRLLRLSAGDADSIDRFADEFMAAGLRHHVSDFEAAASEPLVHPLVRDTYRWLHALATDAVTADDPALWTDWSRIRGELQALAPMLAALEKSQHALWRARINPFSPITLLMQGLAARWPGFRQRPGGTGVDATIRSETLPLEAPHPLDRTDGSPRHTP